MLRINTYILCGVVATGVMACATTPKSNSSIEDARAAIYQVEHMPLAGEVAAQEVEAAHASLREAESLADKHRPLREISNAAYLAKRHAQIAQEQIAAAQAKKTVESAELERQAVLLRAREREASLRASQAEVKAEEADRNAAEASEANQRVATLEKELQELNAKKTDRGFVLTLGDVMFDTGSATLKPGAVPVVDRLAAFMKQTPDRSVMIEGHTDSIGTDDYNQELSQRRADSVRQALISRGVGTERITAVGKGKAFPIASNNSAGGRQQNRRVEIVIENPQQQGALIER